MLHLGALRAIAAQTSWTTPRPCDLTWAFDITLAHEYRTPTYWVESIPFYHGTGTLDMVSYYNGASSGSYLFGSIMSPDQLFVEELGCEQMAE